jgi:hypothetical protein
MLYSFVCLITLTGAATLALAALKLDDKTTKFL